MAPEIQQLLQLAAGCLLNTTHSSLRICDVLRASEGITSIISLLQNQFLNERIGDARTLRATSFADRSTSSTSISPFSPTHTSSTSLSPFSPTHTSSLSTSLARTSASPNPLSLSSQRLADSGVRKVVLYLTGVLMNISRLDAASCVEIGQLGGVEVLVQMIGVSREKQIVYCLECLRACCKQDASCKVGVWSRPDPIGKNGDMWRHHPPNQLSLVVEQPGGSLRRQLGVRGAEQPPRQHPPVLPRQRAGRADADRGELVEEVRLRRREGAQQPAVQ